MPRKPSSASPKRSPARSPKRSPARSPKRTKASPKIKEPLKEDILTQIGETAAAVIAGEGQNNKLIEKQYNEELKKLSPGETNWFAVLTSMGFVVRLFIVVVVMIVCGLVILNVTLDPKSTSWFNQLYKPDWMPDGITITLIFAFLSILLTWVWYRLSIVTNSFVINILFIIVLGLQLAWTLTLYKYRDLTAARYLSCFFLGFIALTFLFSLYFTGFSDISLYTFLYTAWMILVVCFTFGMHELDKEYKLLGIVKDKNSSLYKRKIKMEVVQGIKIDESGNKLVFDPNEQD
jgi:tryptophan-rich sensory protein